MPSCVTHSLRGDPVPFPRPPGGHADEAHSRGLEGGPFLGPPGGEEAWGRSSLSGRETEGREDTRDRKGETRPQAEAGGEDEVAVTLTQAFK